MNGQPFGGTALAAAALLVITTAATAVAAAQQDPEQGRGIFQGKGNCFTCHGREGGGGPLAPDLTDDAWVNFDERPTAEEVAALVKAGVAKPVRHPAPMPPMGGARLSEEEIGHLAAFVLSLSEPPDGTR